MAVAPFISEGKCVSVEWDFLQGLLIKNPPVPCLQSLRKEKSRNAARSRRGKENFEFFELAKMLPLPGAITSQLDKASVIRLTISYLRMREFSSQGDPPWSPQMEGRQNKAGQRNQMALVSDLFEQQLGGHLLQSLDGFVFVVSHEGRFLYISETVSIYLGLSQVELTGSSIFDYVHPADHLETAEQLGLKPHRRAADQDSGPNGTSAEAPELADASSPISLEEECPNRNFFIRMKSTLTKRGLHVKSSGYKVIHVTGCMRSRAAVAQNSTPLVQRVLGLVALAHTLPPSTLSEVRIDSQMFVFRVNMDLQVVYCENRISDYMDLSPAEVVGQSCYHFVHVEDVDSIRQSHEDLLRKGQVVTGYYRWLQRHGGFLWLQSCATISINHKMPHDRNVIWVNYVLSRPELPDMLLDLQQFPEGTRPNRKTLLSTDCPPEKKGGERSETQLVDGSSNLTSKSVGSPKSQSQERKKRSQQPSSAEGVGGSGDRPVSPESDSSSESMAKRIKVENTLESESSDGGEEDEHKRTRNGRVMVQQHKCPPRMQAGPRIKTEQVGAEGDTWAGSGELSLNCPRICIPDSVLTPPGGEAPPKTQFTPSVEALSPPLSGSPLPRDERLFHGSAGDLELLQRLDVGELGGVGVGRVVLPLPRPLDSTAPPSLYAPSTIRYAPAEFSAGHSHSLNCDLPTNPKSPSLFAHLQRLGGLPSFSGFSLSPASLPLMPLNGLHGTSMDTDKEED
ncbi:neuronal PAS domain-containing protein 1 isoform X1 [Erpetoichthys calabaricus]|uniref:neuronal PAS domain-containing protein 1 isoform X1 n=1 Tax=Erpetoichthys calabaricus TaxID=27687 RepID=UPI0022345DA6|nr:neuronal PAS domain-containing protein 1 isoform X1 [Erpetoichthys calabaricus]